jgi:acetyltransferase
MLSGRRAVGHQPLGRATGLIPGGVAVARVTVLTNLFDPDRVAVVGATDRHGSIGRALVENVLAGYDGELIPVNPGYEELFDRRCYPSVDAVPGPVDLAVVAVPAGAVVEVLEQAGRAGVEGAVVISAGFSEAGEAGERREERLVAAAREYDIDLVGPNCLGLVSTPRGLNATFATAGARPGPVSFLSQSGAFVTAVLEWAAARDVGFRRVVSLGNEAVLDEVDFLEAWGEDPETDVILGYVEDVVDGRRFLETAAEVTRETPVVLLKSGRTAAGARAAASHTGSLAGRDRAYDAAFRQAGVLRADSVQRLFDYGQALAGQSPPAGDRVAVLTNAGGPGVLAADAVDDGALSLAEFDRDTRTALEDLLPEAATVANPLDIIGDADLDRFGAAMDLVAEDSAVEALVVIACPTAIFDHEALATLICERLGDRELPVLACLMGGENAAAAAARLDDDGIPNFFDPARAVDSVAALAEYRRIRDREPPTTGAGDAIDREHARAVLRAAAEAGREQLGPEAMGLLEACGLSTPAGEVVEDRERAAEVAGGLGERVVMKLVSPGIVHKSDIGGVEVGVPAAEAAAVYDRLLERATEHDPDAEVLGVQVQELVETDRGVETIVGGVRDPQFGPLVLFGLGGVFVEVFEDTALRVAPVDEREAREMTAEIDSAPLLRGARGREPADLEALVDALARLSRLAVGFPAIREFDVNPLVAGPDGVTAIDFRATIDPEAVD